MSAERCPYTVGRSQCVAGDRGHAGPHDWPTLCTARHIGYQCTERKGHDGLHRSRYAGILRRSWAPRRKAAPMA